MRLDPFLDEVPFHCFGCVDAVHHWHVEVGEYYLVAHPVLVGLHHLVEGFLTLNAEVHLVVNVKANRPHYCFRRRETKLLIINN